MNNNTHRTIYNHTRGCLMAVAAKSSGKASGESRPSSRSKSKSKTSTCRKARSALSSGDMWLQANQGVGYNTGDLLIV